MWKVIAADIWIWFDGLHVLGRLAVVCVLVAGVAAVVSVWPDSASDRPVITLATPHPDQRLIDEAKKVCPSDFLNPCTRQYVAFANGNIRAALCVTNDGLWYFEVVQPETRSGDRCQEDSRATIRATVGGS